MAVLDYLSKQDWKSLDRIQKGSILGTWHRKRELGYCLLPQFLVKLEEGYI